MTTQEFNTLNVGDIIRHKRQHRTFVVAAHYGSRVTALTSVDVTNPDEWEISLKAKHTKPEK